MDDAVEDAVEEEVDDAVEEAVEVKDAGVGAVVEDETPEPRVSGAEVEADFDVTTSDYNEKGLSFRH